MKSAAAIAGSSPATPIPVVPITTGRAACTVCTEDHPKIATRRRAIAAEPTPIHFSQQRAGLGRPGAGGPPAVELSPPPLEELPPVVGVDTTPPPPPPPYPMRIRPLGSMKAVGLFPT